MNAARGSPASSNSSTKMTSRDPDSGSKVPGLWTGAGLGDRIRPMCCQLTLFDERRGRSRPTSSQHPEQQQLPGCGSWDVATQTETERVPVATQTEPAATQTEPEAAAAPPEAPTRVSPPRWRPKERRRGVQAASRRAERRSKDSKVLARAEQYKSKPCRSNDEVSTGYESM